MDKKVYELLNDQINKELYSAYLYLDFSCGFYSFVLHFIFFTEQIALLCFFDNCFVFFRSVIDPIFIRNERHIVCCN